SNTESNALEGSDFGRLVRAIGNGALHQSTATSVLKAQGDGHLVKALAVQDNVSGGYLVPGEFSQDVIDLRRPASVLRRFCPSLPMGRGSLALPKVTSGTVGAYLDESLSTATTQSLSIAQVKPTLKKGAVLVPISNDLIRYSGPGAAAADALVARD